MGLSKLRKQNHDGPAPSGVTGVMPPATAAGAGDPAAAPPPPASLRKALYLPKVGDAGTRPDGSAVRLDHRSAWQPANSEDGYLSGLDNLIGIFEELAAERPGAAGVGGACVPA